MTMRRGSGILLHPTSLPGPHGSGDLGDELATFLSWAKRAGQRYWQVLPLHPTGDGYSPYSALSAFALNPTLVDPDGLVRRGWLDASAVGSGPSLRRGDLKAGTTLRARLLAAAADRFFAAGSAADRAAFEAFHSRHRAWLDDFALFMALRERFESRSWTSWEPGLRDREPAAIAAAREELRVEIARHAFAQFAVHEQWAAVQKLAGSLGISIIGDIPIFVAHDSADVWANRGVFRLDERGEPPVVAGVPPDAFSETGQRWGNPLYRWDVLEREDFGWWVARVRSLFGLVDVVRIDHFRGFAGFWEIPATEQTAVKGKWVSAPGEKLFSALRRELAQAPIIAEDLGVITPDVVALRDAFGLPGMRILQFAFGSGPTNPFLPHNHERNTVVYTGTHDNETTAGWYANAPQGERDYARRYLRTDGSEFHWDLIRAAQASVADLALVPLQDVLGLGADGRMNRPGVAEGNWDWRLVAGELREGDATRLRDLATVYGRLASKENGP